MSDLTQGFSTQETILTADGHKYHGTLRTFVGLAGLQQDGDGAMWYTNGDKYSGQWLLNKRCGGGTQSYADGAVYEGEWKDDLRDGCGHYATPQGYSHEGRYVKGQKHGSGIEQLPSGERYVGGFQNDVRHGRGILDLPNGSVYEGTFVAGDMHGAGTLTFRNGDVYVGEFHRNALHGKGALTTLSTGDCFEGTFLDGVKVRGRITSGLAIGQSKQGLVGKGGSTATAGQHAAPPPPATSYAVEFDKNGDLQHAAPTSGDCRINYGSLGSIVASAAPSLSTTTTTTTAEQANQEVAAATSTRTAVEGENAIASSKVDSWQAGSGDVIYTNGDKYSGGIALGKRHGQGTARYANGDVYEGGWNADRREGHGKMTFAAVVGNTAGRGWRYVGEWLDNLPHGHGQLWYDTAGSSYTGQFVQGRRTGFGHEAVDGDVYDGEFLDDVRHGKGKLVIPDVSISSADPGGNKVTIEGLFRDGICIDTSAAVCTDAWIYRGGVYGTLPHGEGKKVYKNGDVYEGEFLHGLRSGVGLLSLANGDTYEGVFEKDMMHGHGTHCSALASVGTWIGPMACNARHGEGQLVLGDVAATVVYRSGIIVSLSHQ